MSQTNNRKPDFIGYVVQDTKSGVYWTRVGVAWSHGKGGGFTTQVIANPLDGRLVWLPPKERPEGVEHPAE